MLTLEITGISDCRENGYLASFRKKTGSVRYLGFVNEVKYTNWQILNTAQRFI